MVPGAACKVQHTTLQKGLCHHTELEKGSSWDIHPFLSHRLPGSCKLHVLTGPLPLHAKLSANCTQGWNGGRSHRQGSGRGRGRQGLCTGRRFALPELLQHWVDGLECLIDVLPLLTACRSNHTIAVNFPPRKSFAKANASAVAMH